MQIAKVRHNHATRIATGQDVLVEGLAFVLYPFACCVLLAGKDAHQNGRLVQSILNRLFVGGFAQFQQLDVGVECGNATLGKIFVNLTSKLRIDTLCTIGSGIFEGYKHVVMLLSHCAPQKYWLYTIIALC